MPVTPVAVCPGCCLLGACTAAQQLPGVVGLHGMLEWDSNKVSLSPWWHNNMRVLRSCQVPVKGFKLLCDRCKRVHRTLSGLYKYMLLHVLIDCACSLSRKIWGENLDVFTTAWQCPPAPAIRTPPNRRHSNIDFLRINVQAEVD